MEPKRWSLALAATRISTANALIPLMLIGLTLRLYGLGQRGFWWDEVNLWNQALTGGIHDQSHAPFPAWIGGLFMALVGSTDTVIFHLPPAICGTLAIVLAYLVTREISDHPTALLAAALFTLSPLAVYYSQEARPYGLFQLTAGMLLLSLMKARRTGQARWWIAYGVSTAICCLVHLLTLQLVIAFGLFYAFMFAYPRLAKSSMLVSLREMVLFGLVTTAGVIVGTLWIWVIPSTTCAIEGEYTYGPVAFLRTLLAGLGPGPFYAQGRPLGSFELVTIVFSLTSMAYLVLFAYGMVETVRTRKPVFFMFLFLFAAPPAILYLTLKQQSSWPWLRFVSHLTLPYLAIVSVGTMALRRWIRVTAGALVVIAVVLCLAPGLVRWSRNATESRWSYERAPFGPYARAINRQAAQLDGVIFHGIQGKCGNVARNSLGGYYYLRRNDLPSYYVEPPHELRGAEGCPQAAEGYQLHTVDLVESLFGLRELPAIGEKIASLSPGRYAFFNVWDQGGCRCVGAEPEAPPGEIPICVVERAEESSAGLKSQPDLGASPESKR